MSNVNAKTSIAPFYVTATKSQVQQRGAISKINTAFLLLLYINLTCLVCQKNAAGRGRFFHSSEAAPAIEVNEKIYNIQLGAQSLKKSHLT